MVEPHFHPKPDLRVPQKGSKAAKTKLGTVPSTLLRSDLNVQNFLLTSERLSLKLDISSTKSLHAKLSGNGSVSMVSPVQ